MGNPYPVAIQDDMGIVHVQGKANFTDPENEPGGSLPTGWTQDASDPASVTSNGGALSLDGGGLAQTGIVDTGGADLGTSGGTILTGDGDLNMGDGNIDMSSGGGEISVGDVIISPESINLNGADLLEIDKLDHNGTQAGFFGTNPTTKPVVPLTIPVVQDVIDALVTLGLIAQSD